MEINKEKMICPCCGKVLSSDKGGIRYCLFCIRYCDGDGCYVGKEIVRGEAYVLRDGTLPAQAIYSRCEDPLYTRVELLLAMEMFQKKMPKDKAIWGIYDIDHTFGIEEFLKSYSHSEFRAFLDKIRLLRQNGWKYKRKKE